MQIAVVGSGGWGTALAILLHENGHQVTLWSFLPEETETFLRTHENPLLKGVALPAEITYTTELSCVRGKKLVVLATPSFAVRATAEKLCAHLDADALLVSVAKGIEKDSGMRMSEIVEAVTGHTTVALSGPSHAEEVARGIPTGCVAACREQAAASAVQDVFMSERFRVYTSPDPVGVELAAALKNVIALCAGILDGMGCGDNTKALMMTRGLTEIARLGIALGGSRETFAGLAGVGDLIVTCTSMHSRNRRAGILIGKGKTAEQAMKEVGAVVEGYYAAASARELARKAGVDMPISEGAYQILYEGRSPQEILTNLMMRRKRDEIEDAKWVM